MLKNQNPLDQDPENDLLNGLAIGRAIDEWILTNYETIKQYFMFGRNIPFLYTKVDDVDKTNPEIFVEDNPSLAMINLSQQDQTGGSFLNNMSDKALNMGMNSVIRSKTAKKASNTFMNDLTATTGLMENKLGISNTASSFLKNLTICKI